MQSKPIRILSKHGYYRLLFTYFFAVIAATYQHTASSNTFTVPPSQKDELSESGYIQPECTPTIENAGHDMQMTVYGEIQEMRSKILRPEWPIKSNIHQILVVDNPLSDEAILPYSEPVPNTTIGNNISIVASPGEYEPASFVLRAGTHQLSNVKLTSHDLVSSDNTKIIPAKNIDIRVVKPWYQSARILRRVHPGQTKQFVPELLLHDDNLVQVDHQRHVNLVRTKPTIRDALSIVPFTVQACTNKQIWLTIKVPDNIPGGHYTGRISITMNLNGVEVQDYVNLDVEILPIHLLKPEHTIGMFYLGWLTNPKNTSFTARSKTRRQMKAEFIDMKEHGIDTVGLDHSYKSDKGTKQAFENYRESAQMLLNSGFSNNVLAYIDWKVAEADSPYRYKMKIENLADLSKSLGFKKLWVYNQDEKNYNKLMSQRHTFETVHAFDANNIVAVTKANIAQRLKGLLDIAVIKHVTPENVISSLKTQGTIPLAYGTPHSAEERASTTRATYGFKMARKGFAGVFSYTYQSGYCWDDWAKWGKQNYRPSVMAYPTVDKPIPTLQWEGWREAIDDLRYLATYLKEETGKPDGTWPLWLKESVEHDTPDIVRSKLIKKLKSNIHSSNYSIHNP